MQPDYLQSPEAQQIFGAVYQMAYYTYCHWPAFLEKSPEVQAGLAGLAMSATMITVTAQRNGFPQAQVELIRDAAHRAARLQVSREGGPYRVRFANIKRNEAGRYIYEIGQGEGAQSAIQGLIAEPPIEDAPHGLYLHIYRELDITPEMAHKLGQALIDADKIR